MELLLLIALPFVLVWLLLGIIDDVLDFFGKGK